MRFLIRIEHGNWNATGIVVPAEVMAQLGPGRRYPVVVTIDDAKKPEARAARITKALEMLRDGERR